MLIGTASNFTLNEACKASKTDQKDIIQLVVQGLRRQLTRPPDSYSVPVPAVWVSLIRGGS